MQTSIKTLAIRAATPDELNEQVAEALGLYVRISDVWGLLGYATLGAARRAAAEDRLGVATVTLPGRKGRVIKSRDLAAWLFAATRADSAVQRIEGQ